MAHQEIRREKKIVQGNWDIHLMVSAQEIQYINIFNHQYISPNIMLYIYVYIYISHLFEHMMLT